MTAGKLSPRFSGGLDWWLGAPDEDDAEEEADDPAAAANSFSSTNNARAASDSELSNSAEVRESS